MTLTNTNATARNPLTGHLELMCKWRMVLAIVFLLIPLSYPALAKESSLSEGFTIVEMTDAAREILSGDGIDPGDKTRVIGTMLVLMTGNQGYAAIPERLNCHTWVREISDESGRTLFGRGISRGDGDLATCAEFSLQQISADVIVFGADGREVELRVLRRFPVTPIDWSQEIFDRFTVFSQRLGPANLAHPNPASLLRYNLDFASMQASIETPLGADVVTVLVDTAQTQLSGPLDIMWLRYNGYYRQAQPLVEAFRAALVKRYGQFSAIITTKQGRSVYVWAHDLAGNLIAGPEENIKQCYHGTDITVREPLGMISRRGNIGPWSCGVVLAVTALPVRGPANAGSSVISEYQMILYHGHALALKRFARRQQQILITRDRINAIYDAEKPVF